MGDAAVLAGVTIGVTRAAHQSSDLAERLRALGAEVVAVPLIEILVDGEGSAALQQYLAEAVPRPDLVVVTSPNGARVLAEVWPRRTGPQPSVIAVGPGTEAALIERGGPPVAGIAPEHLAEGVVAMVGPGDGQVVVAQGDLARPALVDGLRVAGWQVMPFTVYRTVLRRPERDEFERLVSCDLLTLASASAARAWATALDGVSGPPVIAMGPVVERAAVEGGLEVAAVADPHSVDGLVSATTAAVEHRRRGLDQPAS